MERRHFIVDTVFAAICMMTGFFFRGCTTRSPSKPAMGFSDGPTPIDPLQRIEFALNRCGLVEGYGFLDPITISIIASVLGTIIKYCVEQRILKIQSQVQRRPDGITAHRLRQRMHVEFRVAVANDAKPVDWHVDAAMSAFARATQDELHSLITDLYELPSSEEGFKTANDWSTLE